MKITKDKLMEIANNTKVICWSDMLVGLNLLPLFKKYKEDHNKDYYIGQIKMGKTLMNEIDAILRKRIKTSRDKRVRAYKKEYRETHIYAWDTLQSQPAEAKEDIDYMLLEDL